VYRQPDRNRTANRQHPAVCLFAWVDRFPYPTKPGILAAQFCEVPGCSGHNQAVSRAGSSNVEQAHALEALAQSRAPCKSVECFSLQPAASAVRGRDRQPKMTIKEVPIPKHFRFSMELGQHHDREFETLCLMHRHQSNRVCRFVDLPLAFAAPGLFEFAYEP